MERRIITQKEFLEASEISHAFMQFFDISDKKFDGIRVKDSEIRFCNFRSCTFRDTIFENCTLYFCGFYTGGMRDVAFKDCKIEMSLFENMQFQNTAMENCRMSWNGILDSNLPDTSSSTQFKTITDLSQLTPADVEEIVKKVMHDTARMDVSLRMKIKEIIKQDAEKYDVSLPEEKDSEYEKPRSYGSQLTAGEARGMVESVFYSAESPYKTKKPYEKDGPYKR